MYCALSGAVPDEPVVAKPTGHLYERRLIEKHVAAHGTDPITSAPLTPADLLPVVAAAAAKPRPSPATSVPGLLGLLHNEWDAVALETHSLRTALDAARQDLAHALYQHDAALRVIARLVRERDAARDAYEARGPAGGGADAPAAKRSKADDAAAAAAAAPAPPASGLPSTVVDAMTALSADLSRGRKKRVPPAGCVPPADAGRLALAPPPHPVTKTRTPGVRALAVAPASLVATAGADGSVALLDGGAGALHAVGAHRGGAASVAWVRPASLLASAGADGGAKLWSRAAGGEEWAEAATLAPPPALAPAAGPSAAVATHPSSDYVVLASAAGAWTLYDVATAAALASVDDAASAGGGGFASAAFHPDGVILGAGTTAGAVHVWDARVQKAVASFDGHAGSVAGLAFSENGYHAAAASTDGVRLWDLRKMKVVASAGGPGGGDGAAATGVAFDPAGLLLAAAGPGGVAVLGAKTGLDTLFAAADGRKGALSVAWAPDGGVLWGGGGDHNLRRYAVEG